MTSIRVLSAVLAILHGINAGAMIFAGHAWYEATPGVPGTGPYNSHFVVDIGLAFLVATVGFGVWAWRPSAGAAVAWMAAAWPAFHAAFHVIHWTHGMPQGAALIAEIAGVIGVALLGVLVARRASLKV